MLMKEVDTFFGCFFFGCFFVLFFDFFAFFAKDGVPQSVFVQECFVYIYLQTNIHKQYLQSVSSVKGL